MDEVLNKAAGETIPQSAAPTAPFAQGGLEGRAAKKPPSEEGGGLSEVKDGGRDDKGLPLRRFAPAPLTRGALGAGDTIPHRPAGGAPFAQGGLEAAADERRIEQLKRLSGLLIDRLEQEVTAGEFSVKELRSYTNTLMDLRQIQMTDPRQIAQEQELKLIKLRREAGQLQPRQLRICFEGDTEKASG